MFIYVIVAFALTATLFGVACRGRGQPTQHPPATSTPTPKFMPAAPPSAAILEPGNGFRGSQIMPLRVVYQGTSPTGLREVQLLAQYSNDSQPSVISREDARGTTEKKVSFDWHARAAGSVTLFARAVDQYGQVGESPRISGYIELPPLPPPTKPATTNARYQTAFGIDYARPDKYLTQGEQSRISDPAVLNSLRRDEQSIAHLGEIYKWLKREFTTYKAGGKTIGVVTVDQLLAERRLGGCHDHGLVYSAVVRELGYPAVMARTVSIAWVKRFQSGEKGANVGHVFVEVFLTGKWVLIDSTNGWYVEEGYDPANPVIPLKERVADEAEDETFGFYVERKGIDTWSFGIHSLSESNKAMETFARQLDVETIVYPQYVFQRFEK
jgi:hypothetical protein